METPQYGNASKKQNHKTNLMSSPLNLIKKDYILTIFTAIGAALALLACSIRSPRPHSLS